MTSNRSIGWCCAPALAMAALLFSTTHAFAAGQPRFDGVTLRVATYGGPWKDGLSELIGKEMEKLGAKVEFDTGPPSAHLAKLIAARGMTPPFDLTEVGEPDVPFFLHAGVLQKFDVSKLPNKADLVTPIKDDYLVPDWAFEDGVTYNADKFRELGLPKPTRYSDLLNPKLKGRVGVPNIENNLTRGLLAVLGFAIDSGGSEDNIVPGLNAMKQLGATQFFTGAPAAATAMVNGDIWASFMNAGWAVRVRRAGHPWVRFANLKVGDKTGFFERGYMGFAKGSPNAAAAHYFVNRYISASIQLELGKRLGSVPVNKRALKEIAKDPMLSELMSLTPEEIGNMRTVDFEEIDLSKWHEEWSNVMLR
jgi:putative spermidine/putrescine transport system substrate-binding protein